jgi:hypothetical protein
MLTPDRIHNAKIIFSPLNWGMGHVSRSLPILEQLLRQNNVITVFCSASQEAIYAYYFDNIQFIRHDAYSFSFSNEGFKLARFIRKLPTLIKQHVKERNRINQYLRTNPTDYVISDQRYGFRSKSGCSIFITHQCTLPLPWHLGFGQYINRFLIKRFDATWILDNEKERYAGKLSKKFSEMQHYIGIKSRFQLESNSGKTEKNLKVLLFNGPIEFHGILLNAFKAELEQFDVIIGADAKLINDSRCIRSWSEADEYIRKAAVIYSFCGYTTLMDVICLGCKWRCIPTPGQLEQLYLHKKTLT